MARTYRITFLGKYATGVLAMPSLHYQTDVPTGGDEPDPDDVAAAVYNHIGSNFLGLVHSSYSLDAVVATEEVIPPAVGVGGQHNTPGAVGAIGGSITIPHALSAVINIHTQTRSRSSRGWMKLPSPCVGSYLNGDLWGSSYTGGLTSFANLLDDQLTLGTLIITDLNPVVYSRTRHRAGLTPYTFRVTSAGYNPQARWQRTRLTAP